MMFKNTVLLFVLTAISCGNFSGKETLHSESFPTEEVNNTIDESEPKPIIVGANDTESYLKLLRGKNVGIVANQTSVIFKDLKSNNHESIRHTHLVDSLISLKIAVKKVYAPEHGFRGIADDGEEIKDGKDPKTGIPIISIYGDNKKPSKEQLKGIDIMIFDIQDVGARFYTYISSLHYVMEACAEQNIPLMILDRPNPNGHYVDGPILELENKSFVGMHPIPMVHGMTIGEYAKMINGEKWLKNGIQCELTIIPVKNYSHDFRYDLPIKPSPNLPNDKAINLYPSICLFEGTNVSVGRGTEMQFQIFGSPNLPKKLYDFTFTPRPNLGSKHPPLEGQLCYGKDLRKSDNLSEIKLKWLLDAYNYTSDKSKFFLKYFTNLAGTKKLQQQIEQGMSEAEIRATWQDGLKLFQITRKKYLIYN